MTKIIPRLILKSVNFTAVVWALSKIRRKERLISSEERRKQIKMWEKRIQMMKRVSAVDWHCCDCLKTINLCSHTTF